MTNSVIVEVYHQPEHFPMPVHVPVEKHLPELKKSIRIVGRLCFSLEEGVDIYLEAEYLEKLLQLAKQ